MRYIDIDELSPSTNWIKKANDALNELSGKNPSERSKYIETKQNIWKDKELERMLIGLVNPNMKKCWYSETKIDGDVNIDHFRPKGRNENVSFYEQFKEHLEPHIFEIIATEVNKGWWFLAFDYKNFRVASIYRNQLRHDSLNPKRYEKAKGKSDFFPLKKCSITANSVDDIRHEKNCLLDPCNPEDPQYLKCDSEGKIIKEHPDGWIECRINVSIVVYHLDELQLIDQRKQVWAKTQKDVVGKIIEALKENKTDKINSIKEEFFSNYADIGKEFSSVAIDCINHHKSIYTWLDILFPDKKLKK